MVNEAKSPKSKKGSRPNSPKNKPDSPKLDPAEQKERESMEGEELESSSPKAEGVVVVDPSIDLTVKHPLHNTWTMWYNPASKGNSSKSWNNAVREIWDFSTVEDFWRLFNNLVSPSHLPQGSNYHMFKKGVKPEWEDQYNRRGGKWIVIMPNKGEENTKKFDEAWMWVVLALIGELFDNSDHISGVVVSPRSKNNRIALWTIDAKAEAVVKRIGEMFKAGLKIDGNVGFQCHNDSIKHGTSYRNQSMMYSV